MAKTRGFCGTFWTTVTQPRPRAQGLGRAPSARPPGRAGKRVPLPTQHASCPTALAPSAVRGVPTRARNSESAPLPPEQPSRSASTPPATRGPALPPGGIASKQRPQGVCGATPGGAEWGLYWRGVTLWALSVPQSQSQGGSLDPVRTDSDFIRILTQICFHRVPMRPKSKLGRALTRGQKACRWTQRWCFLV